MAIKVVAMAALLLFVVAAMTLVLRYQQRARARREEVVLSIFLKPDTAQPRIDAVRRRLEAMSGVRGVRYVDKAAAYREFQRLFDDDEELLGSVTADDLPPSFRVTAADGTQARRVFDAFTGEPDILKVRYGEPSATTTTVTTLVGA